MPSVSVIIPVFNAARFLEKCVGSVLDQTFTDFDVCLVDDGSTDGSGPLCDRLASGDERVRVIHLDRNMGVSAARNRGMKETDGRWLCFIDGDDWVTPSYLQELVSAVEDGACDLVVEGLCSVRAGKKDEVTVPQPMELDARPGEEEAWVRLFRSFLLFGPVVKLYRRTLLSRHSIRFPEDVSYGEDLMFNMAYLKYIRRLRTVDKAGYFYRRAEEPCPRVLSRKNSSGLSGSSAWSGSTSIPGGWKGRQSRNTWPSAGGGWCTTPCLKSTVSGTGTAWRSA